MFSRSRGKNRFRVFGNKELRRNKENVQKSHNEKFVICRFTRYCLDDKLEEDKMVRKLEVATKFKSQNLKH
jgi:hypothetical protein